MTRRLWLFAVLVALMGVLPAEALEAGAGRVDITPAVGAPLNGYGSRMGRDSTGVHDPIWARALYLDDGTTKVFLVSIDHVAITPELRARVLDLAPEITPRENIILTATHTHNGPGGLTRKMPIRFVSGRFMPEVLESTAVGITESMQQAYDSRKRAAIGYGTGRQTGLTSNRRVSGGPIDEQIGVVLVEDADGNPISVVTNLSAHPTTISDDTADGYVLSADYPGFYYQEMERLTAPACVAIFLNGTQGNQTVGNPEGKDGWARTESDGKLLAQRAKEVVNGINCGEAALKLAFSEPALPLTLAAAFQPDKAFLQTLEINDLMMAFFPGEACVEIGLEMRKRALERGYAAEFNVGLANEYLMYFTPKSLYAEFNYEASMSFFGPRMEDWFYREFTRLMSKAEPVPDPPAVAAATPEPLEGGLLLRLQGDPRSMGVARGKAFKEDLQVRWRRRIYQPIADGQWLPPDSIWAQWPKFMDPTNIMTPMLGMAARPLLKGVGDPSFLEMEGLAEGAGLPFDAMWLLQNASTFASLQNKTPLFTTPLCTMFAATGLRAGADDLIVARNLDWAWNDETPVVTHMTPVGAHKYVQVGFTWNAGAFTGMNDAGLVLCLERFGQQDDKAMMGPPIEMVLRDLLQTADKFETALAILLAQTQVRQAHVLVAVMDGKTPKAAVVEYGPTISVRRSEKEGILLGTTPDAQAVDNDTRARYARVQALTEGKRIVGDREMQHILSDTEATGGALSAIWNAQTKHSVVFVPKQGKIYVAFPGKDGKIGPFNPISVKE